MSARFDEPDEAFQLYDTLETILHECDYRERTSATPDPWLQNLVRRLEVCVELAESVLYLIPPPPQPRRRRRQ